MASLLHSSLCCKTSSALQATWFENVCRLCFFLAACCFCAAGCESLFPAHRISSSDLCRCSLFSIDRTILYLAVLLISQHQIGWVQYTRRVCLIQLLLMVADRSPHITCCQQYGNRHAVVDAPVRAVQMEYNVVQTNCHAVFCQPPSTARGEGCVQHGYSTTSLQLLLV